MNARTGTRPMPPQTQSGVTLLELVIVTAVIALVFVVLITPTSHNCRSSFTACTSNLKQISLALIVWANDQEVGQFPDSPLESDTATEWWETWLWSTAASPS